MKCKVCGMRLKPTKETAYQVVESLSVAQVLTNTAKTFDAMDCPRCGCQLVLKVRMPKMVKGGNENDQ